MALISKLNAIGDSIRAKLGTTIKYTLDQMPDAIASIPEGTDVSGDTVTANVLLSGYTAHSSNGTKITGSLITQNVYKGTSTPSSSLGSNGDIYIKVE